MSEALESLGHEVNSDKMSELTLMAGVTNERQAQRPGYSFDFRQNDGSGKKCGK